MGSRAQIATGLALLAALGVGAWLANRGPSAPSSQVGEPPDISVTDGAASVGDVRLRFGVAARPIQAFQPVRYRVRAEVAGRAVPLEAAVLSFTMSMTMGDHRHDLVPAADGWSEAEAVLPACASGHRRWYGDLAATVQGRPVAARFQFDLQPDAPPGAAP